MSNKHKEFSLYIKGVAAGMNRSVLTSAFITFGTVKSLDVVPAKSCAFVEFETEEAYQQALIQKVIDIPNMGTVIVEKRKPKYNNRHRKDIISLPFATDDNLSEVPTPITHDKKEFSLYVKGIATGMNKQVLENVFTTFGAVEKLDVVPAKSCAFVRFETEESYQQALMQKVIDIPNLGTVTVEERKQKYNRNDRRRNY